MKTSVGVDLVVDFSIIQMTAHENQRSQRRIYKAASTSTRQLSSPHQNEGNSLRKLVGLKKMSKTTRELRSFIGGCVEMNDLYQFHQTQQGRKDVHSQHHLVRRHRVLVKNNALPVEG